MKVFHNIFKHFSSNHQDKHSDKVNSHQHHGKVDKTHRAKIVEFDKLDNDSQIDNDFGLHIIYFLQHGHWKVMIVVTRWRKYGFIIVNLL